MDQCEGPKAAFDINKAVKDVLQRFADEPTARFLQISHMLQIIPAVSGLGQDCVKHHPDVVESTSSIREPEELAGHVHA